MKKERPQEGARLNWLSMTPSIYHLSIAAPNEGEKNTNWKVTGQQESLSSDWVLMTGAFGLSM